MIRLATIVTLSSVFILSEVHAAWDTDIVVDDPVAFEKADTAETCGTTITYTDAFAEEADLNGDGRMDVIIDHGGAECGGMLSFFCGSGGCSGGIYIARDDGRFVKTSFPAQTQPITWKGGPALEVGRHGSACGRVGANWCLEVWAWAYGGFVKRDDNYSERQWMNAVLERDGGFASSAFVKGYRDAALRIVCDAGDLFVEYQMSAFNPDVDYEIAPADAFTFEIGTEKVEKPMQLVSGTLQEGNLRKGSLLRDDRLIGALENGSTVLMSHGGGMLLDTFSLKGSRLAIEEIRSTCG